MPGTGIFKGRRARCAAGGLTVALAVVTAGGGCTRPKPVSTVFVPNRALGSATVAVAPAINLSGSTDFDPNRFADVMAVELSYADGITVIPVSRVLGVLAVQGKDRIESPVHAAEVLEWLGADAILVFAVTEYEPYDPPRVGISAQVFASGERPKTDQPSVDETTIASADTVRIVAECQQVFDAAHQGVVSAIQSFARNRTADESPYGWRKYVVSQQGYIQFCCHQTVGALLGGRPVTVEVMPAKGR